MKNKVLIVTTTPYMIRQFLMNDLKILQDLGYEVEVATNCTGFNVLDNKSLEDFKNTLKREKIKINQVDFTRSISDLSKMIKSYKQMKILLNTHDYRFIHTHTPIASVISRLVAKSFRRKKDLRVIYTAHGFHFFKGAPLKNWLIFYPIEKWLSRYTDVLITINKEDYNQSKNKFKMNKLEYLPGVGVDIKKFQLINFDRELYRNKLGLKKDDFAILSVGELNRNKNHEVIIRAIAQLNNSKIHYFIAGQGRLKEYLENLIVDLKVDKNIHLLGFRNDIPELNNSMDLFAFPSKREGLGLAAIEAMASGLPLVTSNIHGINDYLITGKTGFSCDPNDVEGFKKIISLFFSDKNIRETISKQCIVNSLSYDKRIPNEKMRCIYKSIL